VKAQEFLKKLTSHLQTDAALFALFDRVADPDVSCKDCSTAGVSLPRINFLCLLRSFLMRYLP
jgi:hypothetical protein